MAVDEQLLRSWIREAQARMALQPLTARQKALLPRTKMEFRAEGPDTTRLLLEGIEVARGFVQRALQAQGIPPEIQATLQQALEALEGAEPEEKSVKEAVSSIAKRQVDQGTRIARQDQMVMHLLESTLPSPDEVTEKAAKRALQLIAAGVQADREDATTARLRREVAEKLRWAKRR
ncbi:MAG: hypothetical protein V3U30_03650 [Thermoplasmata archaeon]